MNKKLLITLPIMILLAASIAVSIFLVNIEPDTSHISNENKLAAYSEPAVVYIRDITLVEWSLTESGSQEYGEFFEGFFSTYDNETVRIGSGSGFVVSEDGYIVTNAHVVDSSVKDDQTIANEAYEVLANNLVEYLQQSGTAFTVDDAYSFFSTTIFYSGVEKYIDVYLPGGSDDTKVYNENVFEAEVKSFGEPVGEGKDVAVLKIDTNNLPTLSLADSEKAEVQDIVLAFGYPGAANSPSLSTDATYVSTITSGKITAVNKTSREGSPVVQMDAVISYGSSGGPVIHEDGGVIGISTFVGLSNEGDQVQGFNFAVPSETIREFVSQSGSPNKSSAVDRLYREGLELYWGGYYNDARIRFEQVERLFPQHTEAGRLIQESEENSANSKILWSKYSNLFYGYIFIASLAILFLLVFTIRSGKKTAAANQATLEDDSKTQHV